LQEEGMGHFLFDFAEKKHWKIITLAGGCFWGMEELFRQQPGVVETQVGYTGGNVDKATYELVKSGVTGHAEAVQVLYDPSKTSLQKLLFYFFTIHDPTTIDRQGNDVGPQYRSSIFYGDDEEAKLAKETLKKVDASGTWKNKVVTRLEKLNTFWRAEEYHQKYLKKNPKGYTCHWERPVKFK
jgi:methionine-S-sulfoxide reductase